ncbi:histone deacetylase family protein [Hyalangium rubrum]|uniref:Histone deacetylase n=1 Tax=Hyalangium rubrum TaxID=3103134 RepID=A0ABU5GZI1_9BACT|nr:histone deacetylase [Hyalangium sp. s54d21]MDY7225942.1 histone deacetylase [Hyalangium sp. s54d21]
MRGWLEEWKARLRPDRARVPVFYDASYRLPFLGLEASTGIEPRRVDFTTWYLLETGVVRPAQVYRPLPVSYAQLARVHEASYLKALSRPETLARIFAVEPSDVAVDALLDTLRRVCGGTLEATRLALAQGRAVANMAGGFHHAAPGRGGGFCALNDIAVALAEARAQGFEGQVVVVDLDAHPPDGTAECVAGDAKVWVGSLSGSDWGPPPGVDEVLLPRGCGDAEYLAALEALLGRMPRAELAFVIAGGDVLRGDRFGLMGLSLEGARARDRVVARALRRVPSVWLPGGGYHEEAWKVFAGSVLALGGRGHRPIEARFDPLSARFQRISRMLAPEAYSDWEPITQEDLEGALGHGLPLQERVLGHYTAQALEYALYRYGLLTHLERLGYQRLRVEVGSTGAGDRTQLLGQADGQEHLLVDCVMERRRLGEEDYLFVNWLALRHPRARFSAVRPKLPGQDVPGLGLSREAVEVLIRMAERLKLAGVAFRPMWYHLAVVASARLRFLEPARQGRFEALRRDLAHLPMLEATRRVAEGRVLLNGQPYAWEAADMVSSHAPRTEDSEAIAAERECCHFTVAGA